MQHSDEPAKRDKSKKDVRTVILIVPFGVPGSGKSTIWKTLKAHLETMDSADWTFDSVSSDGIRAKQMQEFIAQGKTKKEAFDATARSGPQAYGAELARLCADA